MSRIPVLVSLDLKSVSRLLEKGYLDIPDSLNGMPTELMEYIRKFISSRIGFDSGPITCLTRLNGDNVNLQSTMDTKGDYEILDILSVKPGYAIAQFAVHPDTVASLSFEDFLEIKSLFDSFGMCDIVEETLDQSLTVGHVSGDNVICFSAQLSGKDFIQSIVIDEEWKQSFVKIFNTPEAMKTAVLQVFK